MGIFNFLAARKPRSFHWSESQGKMVPCANTPCSMHPDDIVCATLKEAEDAHARREEEEMRRARAEYDKGHIVIGDKYQDRIRAEEHEKEKRAHPDRDFDHEYELWRTQSILSFNGMFVGGSWVVLSSNGLAGACFVCNGKGSITKNDKSVICPECRGLRYNVENSGSVTEMILKQPEKNGVDRRFHDFVRTHPEEFTEYITHVLRSGCYLADGAEDEIYHPWFGRNPKDMMANRPQEALNLMRSLKARYEKEKKEWDSMVAEDRAKWGYDEFHIERYDIKPKMTWGGIEQGLLIDADIIEAKDHLDKKGQMRTTYTAWDKKDRTLVKFVGNPGARKPGDSIFIEGDIWKVGKDKSGRPFYVLGRYREA